MNNKLEEKNNIGALFDGIAHSYDRFNHLMSLNIDKYWRKKAVQSLCTCHEVLDVAVGTGDLSIEILRQQKAEHIIGVDLSDEMMGIAAQKLGQNGLGAKVELRHENAQHMSFASDYFDAVTCAYGVRNFASLDEGLREMARVLKPGGQLVLLDFSYPTQPVIRWGYDFYFRRMMPIVGKVLSKKASAFTYFYNSVQGFIWGEHMVEKLRECGFCNVEYFPMTCGISTLYCARKPEE